MKSVLSSSMVGTDLMFWMSICWLDKNLNNFLELVELNLDISIFNLSWVLGTWEVGLGWMDMYTWVDTLNLYGSFSNFETIRVLMGNSNFELCGMDSLSFKHNQSFKSLLDFFLFWEDLNVILFDLIELTTWKFPPISCCITLFILRPSFGQFNA